MCLFGVLRKTLPTIVTPKRTPFRRSNLHLRVGPSAALSWQDRAALKQTRLHIALYEHSGGNEGVQTRANADHRSEPSGHSAKPTPQRLVRSSSVARDAVLTERMFDTCEVRTHALFDWCMGLALWITRSSCRDNLWRSSCVRLCTQCFAIEPGHNFGVSIHIMLGHGARHQRYESSAVRRENMDNNCGGQTDTFED